MTDERIHDAHADSRYELRVGPTLVSLLDYQLGSDRITLTHAQTDPSWLGRGAPAG